jgi:hypothetical protein
MQRWLQIFSILLFTSAAVAAPGDKQCVSVQPAERDTMQDRSVKETAAIETVMNRNWWLSSPQCVASAVRLLSTYRSARAVPALVDALEFRAEPRPFHRTSPMEYYPAIDALVSIGKVSLPELIQVLRQQGVDTMKGRNALETIGYIFSPSRGDGVAYLRAAAEEQKDDQSAIRLYKAADVASVAWCKTPACNHPDSVIKPD